MAKLGAAGMTTAPAPIGAFLSVVRPHRIVAFAPMLAPSLTNEGVSPIGWLHRAPVKHDENSLVTTSSRARVIRTTSRRANGGGS